MKAHCCTTSSSDTTTEKSTHTRYPTAVFPPPPLSLSPRLHCLFCFVSLHSVVFVTRLCCVRSLLQGSILVAVNPYRYFNIYGVEDVRRYEGKLLGTQPPHIFAIGNAARKWHCTAAMQQTNTTPPFLHSFTPSLLNSFISSCACHAPLPTFAQLAACSGWCDEDKAEPVRGHQWREWRWKDRVNKTHHAVPRSRQPRAIHVSSNRWAKTAPIVFSA